MKGGIAMMSDTKYDYDVIVIGAGPAGANFARLVDPHRYRVLVIDGSQGHDKVCGGLLSPDAQNTLARYDLSLPRDILVTPQLFSVRTVDLGTGLTRYYRRDYLNVDRRRLDDFFRSLIPDSVQVLRERCEEITRTGIGYSLRAGNQTLTCRYLVGADGASSVVRRSLFAHHGIQRYTAIQQWFPAGGTSPYYSCLFDSATSSGCSWIFFKDGALIFGGVFEPQGAREAFEVQKQKLVTRGLVTEQLIASPARTEACTVLRPRPGHGVYHGSGSCYLIGEAAGLISPSSFEGISYALDSGEALADAMTNNTEATSILHAYRRGTRRLTRRIALRYLKRPFMYQPLLRSAVMKSGIASLHIRKGDHT
jgi:flavin-dependent dehydrogenase